METIMGFDKKLINIILVGFAFMFVFTAFQTCSMIEQTVLDSFKTEDPSFNGSGFVSLAIVYIVFAAANWVAPLIVSVLTAKWAMFIGGIIYTLFVALFLHPYTWSLYLGSVLIGIAAAALWTGQGNFLTVNSDSSTIARNSGIFWALLQCSLLFGNLFVYFEFGTEESISKKVRYTVFGALTGISAVGVLVMIAFQPEPKGENITDPVKSLESKEKDNPLLSIKRAFELLLTKRMALLCFPFFYSGLELGFFSGVYGTCIGRTMQFGDIAKQLVGINGMFIGVGEILGGGIFGLMGKTTNRYGRDPIVLLGYVVHMIGFFLIFLNIPSQSALQQTYEPAYITSNEYLAIFCSFLMGFADSCFNTQLYSIVGALYPDDSAPAFALFKFMQALAAAIAFFYSLGLVLQWQLLILVIFGTAGTITFCMVEWEVYVDNKKRLKEELGTTHLH